MSRTNTNTGENALSSNATQLYQQSSYGSQDHVFYHEFGMVGEQGGQQGQSGQTRHGGSASWQQIDKTLQVKHSDATKIEPERAKGKYGRTKIPPPHMTDDETICNTSIFWTFWFI